nr:Tn7-like element transposition protein TnsE [Bacillus wiedmannii]
MQYRVLEIERETRSLSILILFSESIINWDKVIGELLLNLVNSSGVWERKLIREIGKRNVKVQKAKHSKKDYKHREKLLIDKFSG